MGQLIKGFNFGIPFYTPHGWFRNGTEPTPEVKKHLTEVGYKLVPHQPSEEEQKKDEQLGALPTNQPVKPEDVIARVPVAAPPVK